MLRDGLDGKSHITGTVRRMRLPKEVKYTEGTDRHKGSPLLTIRIGKEARAGGGFGQNVVSGSHGNKGDSKAQTTNLTVLVCSGDTSHSKHPRGEWKSRFSTRGRPIPGIE